MQISIRPVQPTETRARSICKRMRTLLSRRLYSENT
jgi:hypothetical protein